MCEKEERGAPGMIRLHRTRRRGGGTTKMIRLLHTTYSSSRHYSPVVEDEAEDDDDQHEEEDQQQHHEEETAMILSRGGHEKHLVGKVESNQCIHSLLQRIILVCSLQRRRSTIPALPNNTTMLRSTQHRIIAHLPIKVASRISFSIPPRGSICLPNVVCRNFSSTWPATDVTTTSHRALVDKDAPAFYTAEQKHVMDKCKELHDSLMPLNETLRGPLQAEPDARGTALPFVLMVGNHSSGKSSFINYVLGRKIQTAGVAPTDDAFTIIAPGPADRDQDGPALIGDPDLGFQQLRQFGPTLMHHTALKIRSDINSNFIMVDSPGMIDSPGSTMGMLGSSSNSLGAGSGNSSSLDRGYDFTGVVRWMAERADIVCLFFDPDKPGTTGETLSVLLHALSGMDHKLLIVLNKADQFEKIHDFARAYGSLCWNLSKVIPRKDLPRIYTMCLPVQSDSSASQPSKTISSALQDLHTARDEVVQEVRKAPARRMDNVLTHLYDGVRQLQMHAKILQDLKERYSRLYWQSKWQQLAVVLTGGGLSGVFSAYQLVPLEVVGSVLATTILATGGMTWYHNSQLQEWERQACSVEELSAAFQRTHAREISEGDEYTAALWQRIRDPLRVALQQHPLGQYANVSSSDLSGMQRILDVEIPTLRRTISPSHYGKDGS